MAQGEGRHSPWSGPAMTPVPRPQMFVHVAEVMGRHYGMVPIQVRHPFLDLSPQTPTPRLLLSAPLLFQHLDLLVRDSSHPSKAGQGHVGDMIKVREGMGRRCRRGRRSVSQGGVLSASPLRAHPHSSLEVVRQVPQGSGAASRKASPLLPPASSQEAVGEQRPRKLGR